MHDLKRMIAEWQYKCILPYADHALPGFKKKKNIFLQETQFGLNSSRPSQWANIMSMVACYELKYITTKW